MNKLLIFTLIILTLVGSYFLYQLYAPTAAQPVTTSTEEQSNTDQTHTFTDGHTGITFSYRTTPNGYVLDELDFSDAAPGSAELVAVYRLMNEEEKQQLESLMATEGPPAINLFIYQNPLNQSAGAWVTDNPLLSNSTLTLGDINTEAAVGSVDAVTYRTDGLYLTENVVLATDAFVFHFTGSFLEEDSDIFRDFANLVDTITFEPTVTPRSTDRIDPAVACRSALAYMTFPDGASADAFVADCMAGNHPEVIERYISDMRLDGTTI